MTELLKNYNLLQAISNNAVMCIGWWTRSQVSSQSKVWGRHKCPLLISRKQKLTETVNKDK